MLEARACYGYYGEGHGATGEKPPVIHKSGWSIYTYAFEVKAIEGKYLGYNYIEINAKCYENAVKAAKRMGKRDGFIIVGDKIGWEIQRNFNS